MEVRSRQLGGKWAGDITRGHKRPGAAWPRLPISPEKQEVGGQQKLGGRCWQEWGAGDVQR